MPKLKNVTQEEMKSLIDAADDVLDRLYDINDRVEKGYCDALNLPREDAKSMNYLTRAAATMVCLLLAKADMQEHRTEIDRLRAQVKDKDA